MASVHVFKAGELKLNPNQSAHWHWNNASPSEAVWSANLIPFATGSTATGFAQDTSLEVTRTWRRLIVTESKPSPQSQTVETKVEHEIHFEFKNLTNTKVDFAIWLCSAAP